MQLSGLSACCQSLYSCVGRRFRQIRSVSTDRGIYSLGTGSIIWYSRCVSYLAQVNCTSSTGLIVFENIVEGQRWACRYGQSMKVPYHNSELGQFQSVTSNKRGGGGGGGIVQEHFACTCLSVRCDAKGWCPQEMAQQRFNSSTCMCTYMSNCTGHVIITSQYFKHIIV